MHEFSIVSAIMEQVIALAQEHQARIITEVKLDVGRLKQIVPEVMDTAWESAVKDTIAEGSTLEMTEIPIRVECRRCSRTYEAQADDFLCPQCGQADIKLLSGDEIILKAVSLENDQADESASGKDYHAD